MTLGSLIGKLSGATKAEAREDALYDGHRSIRWVPTPPVEGTLSAPSTLVVWDFDCTLAEQHMYSVLRTPEG